MKKNRISQIERRAMMRWNGDGIADTLLGFGVGTAGILMLMGISYAMLAAWVPAMGFKWIKDRVSAPRMGAVRFRSVGPVRAVRVTAQIVIILMIVALLVMILVHQRFPALDAFLKRNLEMIVGGFLGLLALTAGIVMNTMRFIMYGFLLVLLSLACRLSWLTFPWVFVVSGGLAFVTGLFILIRFLRDNPVVHVETEHVRQ